MCTGVSPKRIATRNFGFVLFRFAFSLRAVSRNNAKPSRFISSMFCTVTQNLLVLSQHVLHANAGHIRFISGFLGTFYLVSTDNTTVKQPLLLLP